MHLNVVSALDLKLDCQDARMWHNERKPKLAARLDGHGIAGPRECLLEIELYERVLLVVVVVLHRAKEARRWWVGRGRAVALRKHDVSRHVSKASGMAAAAASAFSKVCGFLETKC